jgi:colicin import membrane protein
MNAAALFLVRMSGPRWSDNPSKDACQLFTGKKYTNPAIVEQSSTKLFERENQKLTMATKKAAKKATKKAAKKTAKKATKKAAKKATKKATKKAAKKTAR